MKKKPELEADLDPPGTRHTRPGAKIAERAVANSKPAVARKRTRGSSVSSRPGSGAAARAVQATKPKRGR